ncbi:hypothetical protein SAMN05216327_12332 [Dyadobacter sp. SG02]|nr:hypothetical protein SAMN05216327_12332 [Dyadobacter sp. SG02]
MTSFASDILMRKCSLFKVFPECLTSSYQNSLRYEIVIFFIEKANEYIAKIDRLTASYIPANFVREKPGHQELSDEISDFKLKVKLPFFEFEHGHLLVEKVTRISPSSGNVTHGND